MKNSLFVLLLSFSFSALASDSCQVAINTDELGLDAVEKAKLELQLKKRNYELAFKMKMGFHVPVGNGFGYGQAAPKILFMDQMKLTDKLNDKGEAQFEISRHSVASMPGMDGSFKVDIEKAIKPASEVEIILKDSNNEVQKVLKPKKRLFGLRKDKGSPGYKLIAGLVRDLPDCEDQKSIDDSARSSGKETQQNQQLNSGFNVGSTVFGM